MYIYFIFNTPSINVFLAISIKLQIITSQLNDNILSLIRKLVVDLLIILTAIYVQKFKRFLNVFKLNEGGGGSDHR